MTAIESRVGVDQAPAQLPDAHRYGTPILVRADITGCTRAYLTHLRRLRDKDGVSCEFSVAWAITKTERATIDLVPAWGWAAVVD